MTNAAKTLSPARRFLARLSGVAVLLLFGLCLPASAVLALDPSSSDVQFQEPRLEIPIPNVSFGKAVADSGVISLPWIGQYVQGVYTFLLSIVGLVAAVMMIIGGFQYLTSAGDKGKLSAGKKRITDALIGMVLAFGSYVILYTINPALVTFPALKLQVVTPDPFMDAVMNSTASTSPPNSSAPGSVPSVSSSIGPDGPFSGTVYKTCPLTLTDKTVNGNAAFMDAIRANMSTLLDAKTPMDRVVQVGNIASKCDMNLGNCGRTVGTWFALGGVLNKPDCNQNSPNNAKCNSWPDNDVHHIPDTKLVWWARCDNEQYKSLNDVQACSFPGAWPQTPPSRPKNAPKDWTEVAACNGKCLCRRNDCATGQFEAWSKVAKEILSIAKTAPSMAGYPESWTKDLRRGDWIIGYNGNDDKTGGHSLMFVGWSDKNHIVTLNGDTKLGSHYGSLCVNSGCSTDPKDTWNMFFPITRILRQN